MARYRRGDGHYADVECSNAELERYLVLSCNELERRRPPKLVALVHAGEHRALFANDAAHNPIVGSHSRSLI
jgi:hypothetical protein